MYKKATACNTDRLKVYHMVYNCFSRMDMKC